MRDKKIDGEAVTHLIIGSGATSNPALLQVLRERFNFDAKNPPLNMPYENYLEMVEFVRQALFPDKSLEEGYEALGKNISQGHFQGVVGKINKIAAKIISPEQGVDLYVKAASNALPFATYVVEESRKGYVRVRQIGVPGPPALEVGLIKGGLEATRAKSSKVSYRMVHPEEVIFETSWEL